MDMHNMWDFKRGYAKFRRPRRMGDREVQRFCESFCWAKQSLGKAIAIQRWCARGRARCYKSCKRWGMCARGCGAAEARRVSAVAGGGCDALEESAVVAERAITSEAGAAAAALMLCCWRHSRAWLPHSYDMMIILGAHRPAWRVQCRLASVACVGPLGLCWRWGDCWTSARAVRGASKASSRRR